MIEVERMNRLIVEIAVGEKVKVRNSEEADFVNEIRPEIEVALDAETQVEVPAEWPV